MRLFSRVLFTFQKKHSGKQGKGATLCKPLPRGYKKALPVRDPGGALFLLSSPALVKLALHFAKLYLGNKRLMIALYGLALVL